MAADSLPSQVFVVHTVHLHVTESVRFRKSMGDGNVLCLIISRGETVVVGGPIW